MNLLEHRLEDGLIECITVKPGKNGNQIYAASALVKITAVRGPGNSLPVLSVVTSRKKRLT